MTTTEQAVYERGQQWQQFLEARLGEYLDAPELPTRELILEAIEAQYAITAKLIRLLASAV